MDERWFMKPHWCFDIARNSFADAIEKNSLTWLYRVLLTIGRIDIFGRYLVADALRLSPLRTRKIMPVSDLWGRFL